MSFELRVNGETVWKSDRQVSQVSLQSSRGEAGRIGIADEGVVDVLVTEIPNGGPLRLDQVEALQRQANRERQEGTDRQIHTPERYQPAEDANKISQGEHTYVLDPNNNPAPGGPVDAEGNIRHPSTFDGQTEEERQFHIANGNIVEEETPEETPETDESSENQQPNGGFRFGR